MSVTVGSGRGSPPSRIQPEDTMTTEPPAMLRPAVLVLDVNETLSDLEPMRERFEQVGLPRHALDAWFAATLRDGFALTAAGSYPAFRDVASGALQALLASHGVEKADAVNQVLAGFAELPPHPDVSPGAAPDPRRRHPARHPDQRRDRNLRPHARRGGRAPAARAPPLGGGAEAMEAASRRLPVCRRSLRRRTGRDGAGRRPSLGRRRCSTGRTD